MPASTDATKGAREAPDQAARMTATAEAPEAAASWARGGGAMPPTATRRARGGGVGGGRRGVAGGWGGGGRIGPRWMRSAVVSSRGAAWRDAPIRRVGARARAVAGG